MGASPYPDRDTRRVRAEVPADTADFVLNEEGEGYRMRVLALHALAALSTPLDVNSKPDGEAGVSISGTMTPQTGRPINLPFNPHGWFTTRAGEALSVTTGSGATVTVNAVVARVAGGDELLDFLAEDESEVLLEAGN